MNKSLYNFALSSSILCCVILCKLTSFMANPILPAILILPWKNAFCGLISPDISSAISQSLTVNVTSGFSKMNNFSLSKVNRKPQLLYLPLPLYVISPLPFFAFIIQKPSAPSGPCVTLNP